jgi:gamma-glutamylcyclotransferase (GGCT)/AIG2-like uncharacterized protein YtfP
VNRCRDLDRTEVHERERLVDFGHPFPAVSRDEDVVVHARVSSIQ